MEERKKLKLLVHSRVPLSLQGAVTERSLGRKTAGGQKVTCCCRATPTFLGGRTAVFMLGLQSWPWAWQVVLPGGQCPLVLLCCSSMGAPQPSSAWTGHP